MVIIYCFCLVDFSIVVFKFFLYLLFVFGLRIDIVKKGLFIIEKCISIFRRK